MLLVVADLEITCEMGKDKFQVLRVDCGNCSNETKHRVWGRFETEAESWLEEKRMELYIIGQCLGCDTVSFILGTAELTEGDGSELEYEFENKTSPINVDYSEFPYLDDDERHQLPMMIQDLYGEIEVCMDNGLEVTSGLAMRTLIEAICMNKGYVGSNLLAKIADMKAAGNISDSDERFLQIFRQIGNASTHAIKKYKMSLLGHALEIMNHVLRAIYILPKIQKKVKP